MGKGQGETLGKEIAPAQGRRDDIAGGKKSLGERRKSLTFLD